MEPDATPPLTAPATPDQRLDLTGLVIPISLAVSKYALTQMPPGAVLEIRLRDPDSFHDLMIIVERSGDTLLSWEKRQQWYYLWVRKNPAGS